MQSLANEKGLHEFGFFLWCQHKTGYTYSFDVWHHCKYSCKEQTQVLSLIQYIIPEKKAFRKFLQMFAFEFSESENADENTS